MADDQFRSKGKDSVEKEQLEDALAREYSSHQEQLKGSQPTPERIEQIDELPLTTTGKVRHQALRDILSSNA